MVGLDVVLATDTRTLDDAVGGEPFDDDGLDLTLNESAKPGLTVE